MKTTLKQAKEIKQERYRFDSAYNSIYEYSVSHNAYLFLQKGNYKEYKQLVKENGLYL